MAADPIDRSITLQSFPFGLQVTAPSLCGHKTSAWFAHSVMDASEDGGAADVDKFVSLAERTACSGCYPKWQQ